MNCGKRSRLRLCEANSSLSAGIIPQRHELFHQPGSVGLYGVLDEAQAGDGFRGEPLQLFGGFLFWKECGLLRGNFGKRKQMMQPIFLVHLAIKTGENFPRNIVEVDEDAKVIEETLSKAGFENRAL